MYRDKYIKYKQKYTNLRAELIGGMKPNLMPQNAKQLSDDNYVAYNIDNNYNLFNKNHNYYYKDQKDQKENRVRRNPIILDITNTVDKKKSLRLVNIPESEDKDNDSVKVKLLHLHNVHKSFNYIKDLDTSHILAYNDLNSNLFNKTHDEFYEYDNNGHRSMKEYIVVSIFAKNNIDNLPIKKLVKVIAIIESKNESNGWVLCENISPHCCSSIMKGKGYHGWHLNDKFHLAYPDDNKTYYDNDKKTWKEFRGSRQQLYVITKNNEEPILKWVTIESQCNDILIVKEADLQSSKSLYASASDSDSDSDD